MMLAKADYLSQRTTSGGIALDIRPVSPEDRAKALAFLQATAPPDLRFRFLSAVKPSDALAGILTNVDHRLTEDLIAFDQKDGSVVATAMVARGRDPDSAEIAVLVRSDLTAHGIGWEMLLEACEYARSQGYKHANCVESSSNRRAISLELEQGFTSRPYPDSVELTMLSRDLA